MTRAARLRVLRTAEVRVASSQEAIKSMLGKALVVSKEMGRCQSIDPKACGCDQC